jgi:hypothetical protein
MTVRSSTWRKGVSADLRSGRLEKPSLDDIIQDEWERGGCYAACPEYCFVEPDGWCEHGRPSWMIVFGLI